MKADIRKCRSDSRAQSTHTGQLLDNVVCNDLVLGEVENLDIVMLPNINRVKFMTCMRAYG